MGERPIQDRAGAVPQAEGTQGRSATEPILVSADEAARLLGISKRLVAILTASGELPVVRVRRRTLYNPAALRAWAVARQEGGR